jgi:hypothetical protein
MVGGTKYQWIGTSYEFVGKFKKPKVKMKTSKVHIFDYRRNETKNLLARNSQTRLSGDRRI